MNKFFIRKTAAADSPVTTTKRNALRTGIVTASLIPAVAALFLTRKLSGKAALKLGEAFAKSPSFRPGVWKTVSNIGSTALGLTAAGAIMNKADDIATDLYDKPLSENFNINGLMSNNKQQG